MSVSEPLMKPTTASLQLVATKQIAIKKNSVYFATTSYYQSKINKMKHTLTLIIIVFSFSVTAQNLSDTTQLPQVCNLWQQNK